MLTDESPEAFLIALKDVIDARGENVSTLAKKAGITRQALYQALSEDGNPRFSTITQILKCLNLRFTGLRLTTDSTIAQKTSIAARLTYGLSEFAAPPKI